MFKLFLLKVDVEICFYRSILLTVVAFRQRVVFFRCPFYPPLFTQKDVPITLFFPGAQLLPISRI